MVSTCDSLFLNRHLAAGPENRPRERSKSVQYGSHLSESSHSIRGGCHKLAHEVFAGHILALTSITLNNGASITCRSALARNGAVTLNINVITSNCGSMTSSAELNSAGVRIFPFRCISPSRRLALLLTFTSLCGIQWQLGLSANSPSTSMAFRKLPHSEIFASSGSFCAATGLTDFSAFREWTVA